MGVPETRSDRSQPGSMPSFPWVTHATQLYNAQLRQFVVKLDMTE